ncbi:MAG TPA: purine-nucleoside phosphorylase [Patescibacteria group bacterium]|jgi:purine-nucleoside phosphorylase|nr:purine-nucleoside phosphorylase [Patescibacteria group bacterium]
MKTKDAYVTRVNEAVTFINKHCKKKKFSPTVTLTLGSGLNKLASLIKPVAILSYSEIPHFPISTVPGHESNMILGYLEGVPVLGLQGRKHYYEVAHEERPMDIVTFPVNVVASLGCRLYVATNAAGGLNPKFRVGDLMVITSHIGIFQPNPLLGPHHDFGNNDFFQPQNTEYSPRLRKLFCTIDPSIHEGVYVALTGKTYETQAECLMLRAMGANAVGMSTIPEIITATNRGLETLGVSMITNAIAKDGTNATNHEEVVAVLESKKTEEKLYRIFKSFFKKLNY